MISVIDIISAIQGKNLKNILIKSQTVLPDSLPYLYEEDSNLPIIEAMKKVDWSKVFLNQPTQLMRDKEEQFKVSNSDLYPDYHKTKPKHNLMIPSALSFYKVNKNRIQEFLLHKIKRQRKVPNKKNLPTSVSDILDNYGDICANFSKKDFDSYRFHRNFKKSIAALNNN